MKIIKLTTENDKTLLSNNALIFKFSFKDENETVERYITFSEDEDDEIIGGVFDLHDINGYWLDKRDYFHELNIGINLMKNTDTIFHGFKLSEQQAIKYYNSVFLSHKLIQGK
jgi:hypothetical protein